VARSAIDSELGYDQNGIWQRKYSLALAYGVVAVEAGGALWFGDDSKLGNTFWQTIDASVISGAGAEVLKLALSRARPNQGDDPNKWFQGGCCDSFPVDGRTIQVYQLPFSYGLRGAAPQGGQPGVKLILPVTVGFFNFEPVDLVHGRLPTSIGVTLPRLGIGYRDAGVLSGWRLVIGDPF
jgi:hypothetical protein